LKISFIHFFISNDAVSYPRFTLRYTHYLFPVNIAVGRKSKSVVFKNRENWKQWRV